MARQAEAFSRARQVVSESERTDPKRVRHLTTERAHPPHSLKHRKATAIQFRYSFGHYLIPSDDFTRITCPRQSSKFRAASKRHNFSTRQLACVAFAPMPLAYLLSTARDVAQGPANSCLDLSSMAR